MLVPVMGSCVKQTPPARMVVYHEVLIYRTGPADARFLRRARWPRRPRATTGDRDLGPEFLKKLCKELGIDPRRLF